MSCFKFFFSLCSGTQRVLNSQRSISVHCGWSPWPCRLVAPGWTGQCSLWGLRIPGSQHREHRKRPLAFVRKSLFLPTETLCVITCAFVFLCSTINLNAAFWTRRLTLRLPQFTGKVCVDFRTTRWFIGGVSRRSSSCLGGCLFVNLHIDILL